MPRVKKVVDCKNENGQQLYQVKWESSWETAESLAGCQSLINEFWDYVHNCRHAGGFSPKQNKKPKLEIKQDQSTPLKQEPFSPVHSSHYNFGYISLLNSSVLSTEKFPIGQELMGNVFLSTPERIKIKKENQTDVAYPNFQQSNVSIIQQANNKMSNIQQPNIQQSSTKQSNIQQFNIQQVTKTESSNESDYSFSSASSPLSNQNKGVGRGKGRGLQFGQALNHGTPNKQLNAATKLDEPVSNTAKYYEKVIESWNHPHVKIILVCRVCNKEQKSTNPLTWKLHFLTHSESKPYNCNVCGRGFVQTTAFKLHMKTHLN
ncbi:zinc finger protein 846 isoform X4 [Hydra vulgaris]|uniref:Zinc finger protein 846 isoform X4 n=1 Tax=Hydra vulgaris TaxID=6087 RepID=A0ABM4D6D3_HYDVU